MEELDYTITINDDLENTGLINTFNEVDEFGVFYDIVLTVFVTVYEGYKLINNIIKFNPPKSLGCLFLKITKR